MSPRQEITFDPKDAAQRDGAMEAVDAAAEGLINDPSRRAVTLIVDPGADGRLTLTILPHVVHPEAK